MSLRDRQIQKDIKNKYAQARDEYSKNKPLYSQTKLKEKGEGHINQSENPIKDENENIENMKTDEQKQREDETKRP